MDENELVIAKSILASLQNSTDQIVSSTQVAGSYAYEVMIKGTIASGISSLVCLVVAVAFIWWSCNRLLTWADNEKCDPAYAIAIGGILISLFGTLMITASIIQPSLMAILAPDYVVLNRLIELAIK